jgi:hypothetical protein
MADDPEAIPLRALAAAVVSLLLLNACLVFGAIVVVPVSCVLAHHLRPDPHPWAFERQTNTVGKDVITRCQDASFCPLPADDDALVNTTL